MNGAMRWDIINFFIQKFGYRSYLEIGYYKGWSFDNVNCKFKTAVDPHPCKTDAQEATKYGGVIEENGNFIYKLRSDDFFNSNGLQYSDIKWDIIFIDGMHSSVQVLRDIKNALFRLSPKGKIILHDCNPPLYEHTTTGIDGNWTGDAYKALMRFRETSTFEVFTVNTDWGIGVIDPNSTDKKSIKVIQDGGFLLTEKEWFDTHFNENRKWILNLISIEEFLKKYE